MGAMMKLVVLGVFAFLAVDGKGYFLYNLYLCLQYVSMGVESKCNAFLAALVGYRIIISVKIRDLPKIFHILAIHFY